VLRQVGEQHGQVEADLLGGLVEALAELVDVDLAVQVGVHAQQHVVDLFRRVALLRLHRLAELLGRDPAVAVGVELEEGLAVGEVLHLEEDVEEGEEHLEVLLVLDERVHHLLADRSVEDVALEHGEEHDDHVLLEVHELAEEVDAVGVLAELVLEVGEDVEEAADGVPETTVGQGQLIADTRPLDVFGERVEDLLMIET